MTGIPHLGNQLPTPGRVLVQDGQPLTPDAAHVLAAKRAALKGSAPISEAPIPLRQRHAGSIGWQRPVTTFGQGANQRRKKAAQGIERAGMMNT